MSESSELTPGAQFQPLLPGMISLYRHLNCPSVCILSLQLIPTSFERNTIQCTWQVFNNGLLTRRLRWEDEHSEFPWLVGQEVHEDTNLAGLWLQKNVKQNYQDFGHGERFPPKASLLPFLPLSLDLFEIFSSYKPCESGLLASSPDRLSHSHPRCPVPAETKLHSQVTE